MGNAVGNHMKWHGHVAPSTESARSWARTHQSFDIPQDSGLQALTTSGLYEVITLMT